VLKTVLTDLTGVDDAVKPFYAETDGKFVLQIEGVDNHPEVTALRNAYAATKTDRDAARSERDAAKALAKDFPEDFDAEKWAKLKDGKADEAALIAERKKYEAQISDLTQKAADANAKALKNAIDRDLTDALAGAGVTDPLYLEAARLMLSNKVSVDENGGPVMEGAMGPRPIAEFVKLWAADKGKGFVQPPAGGGAKGGKNGSGPVNAETFAKMGDKERTALFHSDPETFRQLVGT